MCKYKFLFLLNLIASLLLTLAQAGESSDNFSNSELGQCHPTGFQCTDGDCIELKLRCDQNLDCSDGSDEIGYGLPVDDTTGDGSLSEASEHGGNIKSLQVLCDFQVDGGGWTLIQKGTSGPTDEFYKGWSDYVNGFGSLDRNFWLGLENIRALTKNEDQELRIELEDFKGNTAWAEYSRFSISGVSDYYRLTIGGYYGNAGDSISSGVDSNGMRFSTMNNDNDGSADRNCASTREGAWWYKREACPLSNLNGYYYQPGKSFVAPGHGLVWESWRGPTTPLKKVQMKIRKRYSNIHIFL